ncbi:MAG TPA: biotin--[acetyl-CoA-carboxylase] ligase [Candidatus Dormibacteraeota bacterium]|nr:biotin--[acetyl-CoA-carboxylase] ligase [Candidatus Dormibacteraeota bacterium]
MGKTQVVHLASVTSTQDVARDLPIGSIVVADHQTAGRGRFDRRWEAPAGSALLVSFVLEPSPLLSLVVGVAAAEACGANVRLKWPNDLLLEGRKLGGILVEVTQGKAVSGIGINLTWAPPGAAMLRRSRDELLDVLRVKVGEWATKSPNEALARWRLLSETLGRRVRIDLSGHSIEGIAQDIGPNGELIVDGVAYVSGSVTHLP